MRLIFSVVALMALVACQTTVPEEAVETQLAVTEPADTSFETTDDAANPVEPVEPAVVIDNNNPTISDTQDFTALKEKESIESDKARLQAQREKFVEIAPTALPSRTASVNVAAFALQSKNKVGEKVYGRIETQGAGSTAQACRQFRLPDDAQAAFLSRGGPKNDPANLDPDGDGFACDWSPETYRKLLK